MQLVFASNCLILFRLKNSHTRAIAGVRSHTRTQIQSASKAKILCIRSCWSIHRIHHCNYSDAKTLILLHMDHKLRQICIPGLIYMHGQSHKRTMPQSDHFRNFLNFTVDIGFKCNEFNRLYNEVHQFHIVASYHILR